LQPNVEFRIAIQGAKVRLANGRLLDAERLTCQGVFVTIAFAAFGDMVSMSIAARRINVIRYAGKQEHP
jgi:hypothetical protein